ncbi:hypothetical protein D9758_016887 [Tetrapyrgos nigripes]|uniref:ABC transporter domain-containing protein n=1 Tax=Tetrapyrgos nigripes TaxID=182062 RepID=A0A8H5C678_9AGAR|nr:hypothetical protein D9758_016887 [Tetrapyrgos nigripes]
MPIESSSSYSLQCKELPEVITPFPSSLCPPEIHTMDLKIRIYSAGFSPFLFTRRIPTNEYGQASRFIASAGTYANLVRQAKSKQKILEKIEAPRPLRFNFEDIRKLPPPIIAFDEVAFSYNGERENYLYQGLSFGIGIDSRLAILSANGTGKSTLLNFITGVLQPVEGTISRHSALKLAKYSQHSSDQLPYDKSPINTFNPCLRKSIHKRMFRLGELSWGGLA